MMVAYIVSKIGGEEEGRGSSRRYGEDDEVELPRGEPAHRKRQREKVRCTADIEDEAEAHEKERDPKAGVGLLRCWAERDYL